MRKYTNIAIIGLGNHMLEHLIPSLLVEPRTNIYAVYSSSKIKISKLKNSYQIPLFTTELNQIMGNPEIDAVVVAGSPSFHYDIAIQAIKNKKHVFIEKPPAKNKSQILNLIKEATKNNVSVIIGYNFSRGEKIKNLLNKIKKGDNVYTQITYKSSRPRTIQYHYKNLIENGFYVMAIHPFHLVIEKFGQIKKIITFKSNFEKNLFRFEHFIAFESGNNVKISWGNYSNRFIFDLSVINNKGETHTISSMRDSSFYGSNFNKKFIENTPLSPSYSLNKITGYQENWSLLNQTIKNKKPYLNDLKISLYIFEIFEKILKDIKDNKSNILEHKLKNIKLLN